MNKITSSTPHLKTKTVILLASGAAGAVLFICAAAILFYMNIDRLLASHALEVHSQEVLNSLQTSAQNLERMDYLSRLYLTEKDKSDLNTVQQISVVLDNNLGQLEVIVRNAAQHNNAHSAHVCAQELVQQADRLIDLVGRTADDESGLTRKALECRDIITRMQVAEEVLLKQRTDDAQKNAYRNLLTGGIFLIISLVVVLSLFGLLLRDAQQQVEADDKLFDTNKRLQTTVQMLESRAAEAKLRDFMRRELQLCTTQAEAYRTIVRCVTQLLPSANIALLAVNPSRQTLELAATSGNQPQILDEYPISTCCALRATHTRRRAPGHSEIECTHFSGPPPQNYLCVPLSAHGTSLGILVLSCSDAAYAEQLDVHQDGLERIAEMGSMWIASLNLLERFESESIRDGLTKLFNRRFMEISLDRELRLASRRISELSVLMLDIDHFKQFNDTFGHEAGDQVLRGVAEILSAAVRLEDIVCRYGGEEFLIIMPGSGTETALQRAEEIRKRVSFMHLNFRGKIFKDVTVSIGISTYPQAGTIMEDVIDASDRALYSAKANGRNRIVTAESTTVA